MSINLWRVRMSPLRWIIIVVAILVIHLLWDTHKPGDYVHAALMGAIKGVIVTLPLVLIFMFIDRK